MLHKHGFSIVGSTIFSHSLSLGRYSKPGKESYVLVFQKDVRGNKSRRHLSLLYTWPLLPALQMIEYYIAVYFTWNFYRQYHWYIQFYLDYNTDNLQAISKISTVCPQVLIMMAMLMDTAVGYSDCRISTKKTEQQQQKTMRIRSISTQPLVLRRILTRRCILQKMWLWKCRWWRQRCRIILWVVTIILFIK